MLRVIGVNVFEAVGALPASCVGCGVCTTVAAARLLGRRAGGQGLNTVAAAG